MLSGASNILHFLTVGDENGFQFFDPETRKGEDKKTETVITFLQIIRVRSDPVRSAGNRLLSIVPL